MWGPPIPGDNNNNNNNNRSFNVVKTSAQPYKTCIRIQSYTTNSLSRRTAMTRHTHTAMQDSDNNKVWHGEVGTAETDGAKCC